MKTDKNRNASELFEVIVPFGPPGSGGDELFDDCPICLDLKEKIKNGEVNSIPIHTEVKNNGGGQ